MGIWIDCGTDAISISQGSRTSRSCQAVPVPHSATKSAGVISSYTIHAQCPEWVSILPLDAPTCDLVSIKIEKPACFAAPGFWIGCGFEQVWRQSLATESDCVALLLRIGDGGRSRTPPRELRCFGPAGCRKHARPGDGPDTCLPCERRAQCQERRSSNWHSVVH